MGMVWVAAEREPGIEEEEEDEERRGDMLSVGSITICRIRSHRGF